MSATRDRLRGELDRANKRLDVVQNQNIDLKGEVQRLRKQLTIRYCFGNSTLYYLFKRYLFCMCMSLDIIWCNVRCDEC